MFPIEQIIFICPVAVSQSNNISVYKDNTYTNYNSYPIILNNVTIPHSLGMYKTVLSDHCGTDTAISTLSLCGKPIIVLIDNVNNLCFTIKYVARSQKTGLICT